MDLYERRQLRYRYIIILVIVSVIIAVASAYGTYYFFGFNESNILAKQETAEDANSTETISAISESLKSFRSVIVEYYIGEIDESKLKDSEITNSDVTQWKSERL